jgi:hypothetical protein
VHHRKFLAPKGEFNAQDARGFAVTDASDWQKLLVCHEYSLWLYPGIITIQKTYIQVAMTQHPKQAKLRNTIGRRSSSFVRQANYCNLSAVASWQRLMIILATFL